MEKIGNLISSDKKKQIYEKVRSASNFIGQNSSDKKEGFNEFDMASVMTGVNTVAANANEEQKKTFADTKVGGFVTENKDFLGSLLGGLLAGPAPSGGSGYTPPPPANKSIFQSVWFWMILVVIIMVIVYFVFLRKK